MTSSDAGQHRVLLSGVEALARLLIIRRTIELNQGRDTGTFVSGYPGSPLGGFDFAVNALGDHALRDNRVVHEPGLNEELAAAAIWGSQMGLTLPYREVDGVAGVWYGKSPGVDRCGDVLRHANYMGTGPNGAVVMFVGDDPSAKSSTLPCDSQQALADVSIPVLVPGNQREVITLGLAAFQLSRLAGCWAALKVVTGVADGISSVDLAPDALAVADPRVELEGKEWHHVPQVTRWGDATQEQLFLETRLAAAGELASALDLNPVVGAEAGSRIGFVCNGKGFYDTLEALEVLGVTRADLKEKGVRILKLGMTFPLSRRTVIEFATSVDRIVVLEEKRPFIENQLRAILHEAAIRTPVEGKKDGAGTNLVPVDGELTVDRLSDVLRRTLPELESGRTRITLGGRVLIPVDVPSLPGRPPAYCSGCPHNRSTVIPEGGIHGVGVGCHSMVIFEPRHQGELKMPTTPMGSEGVPWIGLAPFADGHLFQNLGDGTFSHSGSLAIRACVAAGSTMTFKLLVNSAVAMTGGQPVVGLMDVPSLTRELQAEGVKHIAVCSDDVHRYDAKANWAPGVTVHDRAELEAVQVQLSDSSDVSVLIYDQQCAAEARRLRKRGLQEDPPERVLINDAVCEGCGDCGTKSNCLSVLPRETEFGTKRTIDQSSCNKDYSCLDGDCPSFITITAKPHRIRRRSTTQPEAPSVAKEPIFPPAGTIPEPVIRPLEGRFSVYLTGIGGSGIVTANRLLARAAIIAGMHVSGMDQTGLSQKAGAVVSHLLIGREETDLVTNTVTSGGATLYISGDILQAASAQHLAKTQPGVTFAIVDADFVPSGTMLQTGGSIDPLRLRSTLERHFGEDHVHFLDSTNFATEIFGNHLMANVMLLGAAFQAGAIPLPSSALEAAIAEGSAAELNLAAFQWGRLAVGDPSLLPQLEAALPAEERDSWPTLTPFARTQAGEMLDASKVPASLRPLIERRVGQLIDYQNPRLAVHFLELVYLGSAHDDSEQSELTASIVDSWFKLLSYKDEYEVARLHLGLDLDDAARSAGISGRYRVKFKLHPPILRSFGMKRKIALGRTARPAFTLLRAMRPLRGTPLDVFGWSRHRREERQIAKEYRTMLQEALADPQSDYAAVVSLARLPLAIKGYGDIKSDAVAHWRSEVATARGGGHLPQGEAEALSVVK